MKTLRVVAVVILGLSWALLITLVISTITLGQMTVVSTEPSNGAEQVSTDLYLALNFSQQLDTTMEFEASGGFFIGLEISPNPGDPESVVVTQDGRGIVAHFHAAVNTTYRMLISGARSKSGEDLDQPYAVTFSTGALPTGSISGTVSFSGPGSPIGAMVLLLPDHFFTDFIRDEGEEEDSGLGFLGAAVITDPGGQFTLQYLDAGTYVLAGIKDLDQDGLPTVDTPGEGIGFYDFEGDRVPNLVDLAEGASLTDMDLTLFVPTRYTGGADFDNAKALAVGRRGDAQFFSASGRDLTISGEGMIWIYGFYSPSTQDTLATLSIFHFLYPLDRIGRPGNIDIDPLSAVEIDWIDTDVALSAAEDAGGADFRAGHPESLVDALLFNAREIGIVYPKLETRTGRTPVWLVSYYDEFTSQGWPVFVDAESGEVLYAPGLPTTAERPTRLANEAARNWYPDASLVAIRSLTPLDEKGRTISWAYTYYSPAAELVHEVVTSEGQPVSEQDVEPSTILSRLPLPYQWLDSDAVLPSADAASAAFRSLHTDVLTLVRLSCGAILEKPDLAVWEVTYIASNDQSYLIIYVDAITGLVTTTSELDPVPTSDNVIAGFPNPFSDRMHLRYRVDKPGPVSVSISNILGQQVRFMADPWQSSGTYEIMWDGKDDIGNPLPPGVYVYRLEASGHTENGTAVLAR